MRVMLCCSELGLGHVSRIMPLGKELQKRGHSLFFFSGGKAYQLLKREFNNVHPCTPVAWYENASGIVTSASLINILIPLPVFDREKDRIKIKSSTAMETVHRYYDLRRDIRKIKPDLIVADGDLHALRMASRWKFPAVYIANVIRPSFGFSAFLNPGERLVERYVKQSKKIVIPDNPPPYTICEQNLGDLQRMGLSERTEFVGSFLDTTPTEGRDLSVFAPISGPYGTRVKLLQMILPVLEKLETKSIVSLGTPETKIKTKKGNCEIHSWLSSEERQKCMKDAKLIIFSGGHRTCFETIKYGKPSICIPTQPEQMGNAVKLQKLNCSITVKNGEELRNAIRRIETENEIFKQNIKILNAFSTKFNGLKRSAEIIESILN
jgi:UDP-N-acetylglucosamine--N-acetylmuramyl-(pentapeptide) pyrophosphoryl-undecaprenol N-acetylglucosamine transferase